MRLSRALTPFVVLAAVLGARTPQSATSGTIDGVVTNSSLAPIAGATVTILQSAVPVETDPAGHFRILQVPGGQYLLVIRKVGYHPVSGIVEVDANEGVRLAYTLHRVETVLDTMRVVEQRLSMKMTEFEARRKGGEGRCWGGESLRRTRIRQGESTRWQPSWAFAVEPLSRYRDFDDDGAAHEHLSLVVGRR